MRKTIKASLDIIVCVVFLILLEPKLAPLSFHEWGGLFIGILFIVHTLLNREWIAAVSCRFFSRCLPARARFNYLLDLILLACFTIILLTGMAISKTIDFSWLFPGKAGYLPRVLHGFASFVALAVIGIHLGMHWDLIATRVRRNFPKAKEAARA